MKILIVSDTHRKDEIFHKVLAAEKPIDMLVHAGDAEGSEQSFLEAAGVPMHYVAGNNDFFTEYPDEEIFYIGTFRTFLTHGHRYYVSASEERLLDEARAQDARILIYGHTHRPVARWEDGMLILNPGSLAYPRQIGRQPSYIVLETEGEKIVRCDIRYLL